jgi:hypothetical protein
MRGRRGRLPIMSNKVRIAFAVLAGYYLGRRRKLRMAAALAAAGLAGRAHGGEGGLLTQGIKALGSSPEIGRITDRLRGDLMEVGKAAAVAATSRQIDSLSSKLHDRADALRTPAGAKEDGAKEEGTKEDGTKEDGAKRATGRRTAEEDDYEEEDYEEEDEYSDEEEPEEPEEPEERAQEEPAERNTPRRPRPVRRASPARR